MNEDDLAVGWTTVGTAEEADALCAVLLEGNRAACTQIDPPIRSLYRWKGKPESETEVRVWIKTTVARARGMEAFFAGVHPYETPQWIWVTAAGADTGYAEWVRGSVAGDGKG